MSWKKFKLHQTVATDRKSAARHFTNLERFGDLHPLIKRVEKLKYGEYLIYERPISWIPINIKYKATVAILKDFIGVKIQANPNRFTNIKLHFSFKEQQGQTNIKEYIEIKSLPIAVTLLSSIIYKSHTVLLQRLAAKFDKHQ